MTDSVLKTIMEYGMLVRGERVVCATSGGADSVAMLRALCILSDELGISICAAHLNHGLRGEESDRDEAFVRNLCEHHGVPLYTEKVEIKGKSGIEERARDARYAFYDRALEHFAAQKVATAHNAEDNLETVIFHLCRGSGLEGLCGIPPVRGRIIRPLIFTKKAEILGFLKTLGQDWVEDSSNAGDEFTRNLIRHKILPVMEEVNGEAVKNAARTVKNITSDRDLLNKMARDALSENSGKDWICVSAGALPRPILSRAIRIKCEEFIKNQKQVLDFRAVCDIIDLICAKGARGTLTVSRDLHLHRIDDRVYFSRPGEAIAQTHLKKGESIEISGFKITCLCDGVTVRARRDGDKIKLAGRRTRLVKKVLCDAKVPHFKRDLVPIIEKDKEIIALCGFGYAEEGRKSVCVDGCNE